MKANAPEKIYIGLRPSISGGYVYTTVNKDFPNAVEYICADSFIEKACKAYCKMCKMPNCNCRECKFIEQFKKYMEE